MYLSDIVIKKFRNFSELTVKLSKGLNVLVGENNIGKTNLLDAIRVALGSSAATGEIVRVSKEDRHRNPDGTYCTEPIRISLIFSALSEDEQGQFIDILNYDPENPGKSTAQINYEWNWNEKISRWNSRRWGGAADDSDSSVPEDLLQSIPITLLGALRDALSGLMPGRQSRLGHLLQARATDDQKEGLQKILLTANDALEKERLISSSQDLIGKSLEGASGKLLSQKAVIRASEPDFERIVHNLRLVLKIGNSDVIEELRTNGLGYNNLLFIGTVTTELEVSAKAILPLLLVEEPEAHLHPQLQTLLANFLAKGALAEPVQVQTIITTHSPSIAAHVSPSCLKILHRTPTRAHACLDIASCNLSPDESSALRRMLDVTRATMLFSRGVVLVEGITEALLIPVLAQREGFDLEERSVSIIPICGVSFMTLAKLFGEKQLQIPLAIITDADPATVKENDALEESWKNSIPARDVSGNFIPSDRLTSLIAAVKNNPFVSVFSSQVTLEYDLALAGQKNGDILLEAWKTGFDREPRTFSSAGLNACGTDRHKRAICAWRGICLSNSTRSKAFLAQELASKLSAKTESGTWTTPPIDFVVPPYIKNAIKHVCEAGVKPGAK